MPRAYGTTNAARFSSAPAVGPAGDTYYNTTNNTVYISNGTVWVSLQDVFTSSAKGVAPASGGGTANFLRADGTWAAPTVPAGGTSPQWLRAVSTGGGLPAGTESWLGWSTSYASGATIVGEASGRYRIDKAGTYRVDADVAAALASGSWMTLHIHHLPAAGGDIKYDYVSASGGANYGEIVGNCVLNCVVNDRIYIGMATGVASNVETRSWLTITCLDGIQGPIGPKGDTGAQGAGAGGNQTLPAGMISPFAGGVAPADWFMCDGQAVSRGTYSNLYTAIGTTYGVGNGTTTFNVPDLRGRSIFGIDNMGGTDAGRLSIANTAGTNGGSETHTLNTTEMPAHAHTYTDGGHYHGVRGVIGGYETNPFGLGLLTLADTQNYSTGYNSALNVTIQNTGGGSAHNNMPPFMALNYIIKS